MSDDRTPMDVVHGTPYLEAVGVSKIYDTVAALQDVSIAVRPGEVVCLLGDNGAGKSTLIGILSGVMTPDTGTVRVAGRDVRFASPNDALDSGIATVFQDLAIVPIMPVFRNFFLGREPVAGRGPFRRFDVARAKRIAYEKLIELGVEVTDVRRPISTLSGGQRQSVAVARAVHFGARILILDEPTSALGVKQAAIVLDLVRRAKEQGIGVILITHNAQHAYPIGDTFVILALGKVIGTFRKADLTVTDLMMLMSGTEDLSRPGTPDRSSARSANVR
jgi:simple sugar transport system ATP-binding protein